MKKYLKQEGYIALASVLVIAAVVVVIGTSTSLLSISEAQMALADINTSDNFNLLEACVEEALLMLNETNNIPNPISLPKGTCDINIVSHTGNDWVFTVIVDLSTAEPNENYFKGARIDATRYTDVTINSWEEITP